MRFLFILFIPLLFTVACSANDDETAAKIDEEVQFPYSFPQFDELDISEVRVSPRDGDAQELSIAYTVSDDSAERALLDVDEEDQEKYDYRTIYGPYERDTVNLGIRQSPRPIGLREDVYSYDDSATLNSWPSIDVGESTLYFSYNEDLSGGMVQFMTEYKDTFYNVNIEEIGSNLTNRELEEKIEEIFLEIQDSYRKS
ncbi:hypothetical protein [Texcoconibacillus texcoconensis]|uniref:Lipoprotein n=1 Tax=Texcoconibacillus texcoconensis TaxID=1095777 RepID=A0A840QLT0_9BACI|nr:hypothetical protein [Texcoconibacillus texcoconensis]MBB5172311.1 hypothetical protein [Texcoconibacillus texcoconensis]